jgi:hypothetical protein
MTACVLWCCLSASAVSAPAPDEPAGPKPVVLLADSDEYKAAKAAEAVFEGAIENNPGDGVGKPTRFNAYRLRGKDAAGKEFVRELYVPGKAFLLAAFVEKRVRVTGKFVDTPADGKVYAELWPAQLVETAAAVAAVDEGGVHARCDWQPGEAMKFGKRVFVFRDGRELAKALRLSGEDAATTAGTMLAQKLDVRAIDWDKRMLVTVAAGLRSGDVERLTVTRVEVKDGAMTVYFRTPPRTQNPGGFCYPAETVLVDRFDGAVRAEPEPADAPKAPAEK